MGHHYVPREYLRAFETPALRQEIWVYDKRDREARILPIKAVAQSPKFYEADVETKLAEMEGQTNAVLRSVRSTGQLRPEDRPGLAYYVAVMLYRSPRHRRQNVGRVPGVLQDVVQEFSEAIEKLAAAKPDGDPIVARRRQELDDLTAKYSKEPPKQVKEQVRSPWPSENVLELISRKTWRLLVGKDTEPFVTSDSPAVFFEGLGLANPDSELTMPLSPSIALIADHKSEIGSTFIVRPNNALVREVNRRVIADAERFVFASTPQPWVPKVAAKKQPYLSRIKWDD